MIENIKNIIARFILRKYAKSRAAEAINFSKFFSNSGKILLIAPVDDKDLKYIEPVIKFLNTQNKEVSVFIAEHRVSLLNQQKNIQFITFALTDINKLNLPSAKLKHNLTNYQFDIVIDLNSIPNRFFRAASVYCHSKVSIGFKGENADIYYNFQIQAEINTKKSYENLLNSLNMF